MSYANNPDYPYPELLPFLLVRHTPNAYRAILAQISYLPKKKEASHRAYENFLTDHVYARCPLCQQTCHEPIDTYGLPSNNMKFRAAGPFFRDYPDAYPVPCKHYIGTHSFLNLHEQIPTDFPESYFSFVYGEVPYVSPRLLADDPASYAVLHALPICRIEDKNFVPRYTRFILTYFSARPRELIQGIYARESNEEGEVPWLVEDAYSAGSKKVRLLTTDASALPIAYRKQYDLEGWAAKGKLGWLDYTARNLPLKIGANQTLPPIYRNISGRRYSFLWNLKTQKIEDD